MGLSWMDLSLRLILPVRPFDPAFMHGLFCLTDKVPGQLLENILEHGTKRMMKSVAQNAVLLRFLGDGLYLFDQLFRHLVVLFQRPFATRDQMVPQAQYRVAQRPLFALFARPIGAGIIRCGVTFRAIGKVLYQRWTLRRSNLPQSGYRP